MEREHSMEVAEHIIERIKEKTMRIECIKVMLTCLEETKSFLFSQERSSAEDDFCRISLTQENTGIARVGKLMLSFDRKDTWDMDGMAEINPVELTLTLMEKPKQITAMYLFNPWWTRPAFPSSLKELPQKTKVLFLKMKDHYSCLLLMAGREFIAEAKGGETDDEIRISLQSGISGQRKLEETVWIQADGQTLEEAVRNVFACLKENYGILLREDREFPECFQHLGWCSWDAFYKEINEEKFYAKAKELIEKKIPVRWMLFDDGWLTGADDMVAAYQPDPVKFPRSFDPLISEIKKNSQITWFGVWHAFGGYWAGIDPDSSLAREKKEYLYQTVNGRLVPDPEHGAGFYCDWYEYLKNQQIDFVKVDGQSAGPIYFTKDRPIADAVRGMSRQLEEAVKILDKNVINCMGMGMENILTRPSTGLSRNSDDFVPKKKGGFAEHLLQNAYNAIYHNQIYHCDWDMFWTTHPDAVKHSLLRAISGGPIYFSDRIGETNPDIIKPLVYRDGRILRMDQAAKPTADCIFKDPMKEGVLKLYNTGAWGQQKAGGIAIYNLTAEPKTGTFSPCQMEGIKEAQEYWVYDFFRKEARMAGREEILTENLPADGYAWFVILPKEEGTACLGLSEKYAGFLAVGSQTGDENSDRFIIKERGPIAWLSEQIPSRVLADGIDVTEQLTRKGNLSTLSLPEQAGSCEVTLIWKD